ncbi:ATP-binding protein [Aquabacterium sp.]|uniref:ATP-binding protein n=1 Tax=Aquabacterium sp. TaxID=1872578 RepID=UPI0024882186|nr:ATP-binding protein [Aquabacterium sp.]MDI1260896.1 ATP-binding protein [Aquabacterium sp.]
MSLSLSSRVLLQVGLLMAVGTGLTTALIYRDTVQDVRALTAKNLQEVLAARAELDAQPFEVAQDNILRLRDAWLERLRAMGDADPQAEFNAWFARDRDGVTRIRPERDDHHRLPSMGLLVGVEHDALLRRQVMSAFDLLREWGPLMTERYYSAYIALQGKGIIMYSPSVNWGRLVDKDTTDVDEPSVRRASLGLNPKRSTTWTDLYFDDKARTWMVSAVAPIDVAGQWVGLASQDVSIDALIARTIQQDTPGVYSLILTEKGELIAHPHLMDKIRASKGELKLNALQDPVLAEIYKQVKHAGHSPLVRETSDHALVLGIAHIAGPNWYSVTVYPRQVVDQLATNAARNVVLLGALALLAELLLLAWIVQRQINRPLRHLQMATDAIEAGDAPRMLSKRRDDELGQLSESFNRMALAVRAQVKSLKEKESYLRLLIDTLAEGMVVRERDLKLLDFNDSALALYGVTREQATAVTATGDPVRYGIRQFRPDGSEYAPHELPFQRMMESRQPVRGELIRILRSDGTSIWGSVNVSPLFREGEAAPYAGMTVINDVTRYIMAEQELRAANDELERRVQLRTNELQHAKDEAEHASRAKTEFLSGMSHELRTPLNAILGFAQLLSLAKPPLSDADLHKVRQIEAAGWHLLELINEVLDLASIEAGAVGTSMESLDLGLVIEETLEMVGPVAVERNVVLLNRSTPGQTHWVLADRKRLKQVLSNLLSNGVKYNRYQGTVTVTVEPGESGQVVLVVSDTGRGLTPQQLERLFQPFTRFETEGEVIQGTGIGLVITRRLVELMGGQLTVESAPGQGSMFRVHLKAATPPAGVAEKLAVADGNSLALPGVKAESRLLYVEDNPSNVELFVGVMALQAGYRVEVATDGLQGLAMARANPPDLAVIDINLPGIDGIELCRRLKGDPATRHIPLIALSANAMPSDVAKAQRAGFDVYLTKPLNVVQLFSEIDRMLNLRE